MDEVGSVVVRGDEIDADVGEQIGVESLAAVDLVSAAGEVTLEDFGDGQAGNTENTECFFHGCELGRGDYGSDEFHGHPFSGLGDAVSLGLVAWPW
ncbi:MAG: hypothetical protein WA731_07530, partial [Pseudonocardiaceae bacterium]